MRVFADVHDTGKQGLFLIALVTFVFAAVGFRSPAVAIMLVPLPALVASMGGFFPVQQGIMFSIEALALILGMWMGRRNG